MVINTCWLKMIDRKEYSYEYLLLLLLLLLLFSFCLFPLKSRNIIRTITRYDARPEFQILLYTRIVLMLKCVLYQILKI
jgi:hypothetical protein